MELRLALESYPDNSVSRSAIMIESKYTALN